MSRKSLLLAALSLALLVLALSLREEPSPDAYFHLAAGRTIVHDWRLPRTNEFLQFEQGFAFVDHEWLFQIGAWLLYAAGGASLLGVAKALVVLAAFVALHAALRPAGAVSALLALLPAILVAESRFVLRPEVVSLLGTAATLALLERDRLEPRRWHLVVLAVLQVVWVNCHGFALMGPGVTFTYFAAQLLLRALGKRADSVGLETTNVRPGRLGLFLAIQLGASFVNPWLHQGALYPVLVLLRAGQDWKSGGLYMRIVELQSPFGAALSGVFEVVVLKLAIGAAVVGFGLSLAERRARLEHLLAAVLLVGSASSYIRNLPFAAVGLSLPIAHGLAALGRRLGARAEIARWVALASLSVTALVTTRAALADQLHGNSQYVARAGLGFSDFLRYDEAVSFLEASPPQGNLFNNFGAGHFLLFARDKKPPLPYICGNTELYPGKFLVEYHEIVNGRIPYGPLFEKRGITDALLDHRVEVSRDLIATFHADPAWRLVHADGHCVIYRKVDAKTPPAVDLARLAKTFPFKDTTTDDFGLTRALRALGVLPKREAVPLEELHVACLLETLGRTDDALALARRACTERSDMAAARYVLASLEWKTQPQQAEKDALLYAALAPNDPHGFAIAGQAALAVQDPRRAAGYFEKALAIDPGFELAQRNVLGAYLAQEPPDMVALKRALASWTNLPEDLRAFYEAQAANVDNRTADAEKGYRDAIALRESFHQAHWELGRCLFRRRAFEEAQAELEKVVKALPREGSAWRDLGLARVKAGDARGGKDALEIAATLRPRDPEPLVDLGYIALDDGDKATASRFAREALARRSGDQAAKKLLALAVAGGQ